MSRFTFGSVIDDLVDRARSRGDDLLALSALRAAAVFGAAFALAWVVSGGGLDTARFRQLAIGSPSRFAESAGLQAAGAAHGLVDLDGILVLVLALALTTIVAVLFDAAMVARCLDGRGRRVRPDAALTAAVHRAPALIAAALIAVATVLLTYVAVASLVLVVPFASTRAGVMFWSGVFWTSIVVAQLVVTVLLLVLIPAILAEGRGPLSAIRRSVRLARGHLPGLIALVLLITGLVWVVDLLITLPVLPLAEASLAPTLPLVPFVLAAIITGPLFPLLSAAAYERLVPAETEAGEEPAASPTAFPA